MINAGLFPALETLLAVARTGSVAAAARQRHITSSAVSQQIRRLETHFGIKLLERAGRGVRLTATGEAALPVVRELWTGAESAFGQLAAMAGHPVTTLRVAASDYLGKGLLAPVLRDLLDADPPVRFEIVTTHSRAGVRLVAGGDVDLAVVTGQEIPRGLEERRLFDQPFVWVGPRRRRRDRAPLTERMRLQVNVENLTDRNYFINADSNTNISPGSGRGGTVLMTRKLRLAGREGHAAAMSPG